MIAALLTVTMAVPPQPSRPAAQIGIDAAAAARFAELALACVHKEYPNKVAHVLNGDADARPPRELTPAFYGCYDWHSSVHGHWPLARLARRFPDAPFAPRARAALASTEHHSWRSTACGFSRRNRMAPMSPTIHPMG